MKCSNNEFLTTVFGNNAPFAHVTSFRDDPSNITLDRRFYCWSGGYIKDIQLIDNSNQYYTISIFNPDARGKARRQKALFMATYVIVADDVREKLPINEVMKLPLPTFKLETSPGSEQWGWVLDHPCAERYKVENLLDGLVAKGLAPSGKDPGMKGVTRYVRLPEGVNTKASRVSANNGTPPPCRMVEWSPEQKTSIESLAEPFNVDLEAERREGRIDGASAIDDHPILELVDIINVKSIRSDGRFDITCPWVDEHTNAADDGSAIFTNADGSIGFKCHHGSCEQRTGNDLLDKIEEHYVGFRKRLGEWKLLKTFASFPGVTPGNINSVSEKQPLNFIGINQKSNSLNFINASANPDEMISFQVLIDRLKRMPYVNEEAIQMSHAILKAVDGLDHARRQIWHNQIKDHMHWSKPDLHSILEQQRKEWYPQTRRSNDFFQNCVYVSESNQFYNYHKRMWLTPDAYQNTYGHLNEDARHEALIEGRVEKVDRYDYAPGMPLIFEEYGIRHINGWTDIIDQSVPGDVQRWLNHFDVLGWNKNKKHMLQWMAFTLRHPEQKINHMLILGGGEGTGKDFLLNPLIKAFGRDSRVIDGDELLLPFNDFLMGTKYVHINETELGDRKESKTVSNKLKPIACSPPERIRINIKGVKGVDIRNIVNGTMTSNSAVPLNLGGDSRRYYAVWTSISIRGEDGQVTPEWKTYWHDCWNWMRDCQGWKACVYYLMHNVDLSDFDPGAVPLLTDYLRDIQEASEDPLVGIIKELKKKKLSTLASDLVTASDICDAIRAAPMLGLRNSIKSVPSPAIIGKVMKQGRLGVCVRAWRGSDNLKVWILRNGEKYCPLGGRQIADEYFLQHEKIQYKSKLVVVPNHIGGIKDATRG